MLDSAVLSPKHTNTSNSGRHPSRQKARQEWEPMQTMEQRSKSSSRSASTTRMQQATAVAQRLGSRRPSGRSSSIMPPTSRRENASSTSSSRRYSSTSPMHHGEAGDNRPRSISTGRIFQSKDDPTAVARSIMELREKREKEQQSSAHGRLSAAAPPPPPPPDSVLKQHTRYTKPSSGVHNGSNSDPSATRQSTPRGTCSSNDYQPPRFQNVERKIEGFRDELKKLKSKQEEIEEMQFFSELESAGPSVTGMLPPPPPPPPTSLSSNKNRVATPTPSNTSRSSSTPRNGGTLGIPAVIRAIASPTRGGRLPPPKKEILSPRKIAALDRTSLELEAQTLGRQVQILEQEKANLIRTVEMYDNTCQQDTVKMRRLEEDMKRMASDLNVKVQDAEQRCGLQRLEYEQRLNEQSETLISTQGLAEELEHELAQLHEESQKQKADFEKKQSKLERELQHERDELQAQATNFETRIIEVNVRVEKLQQKLKSRDKDVSMLKEQLAESAQALTDAKTQKDEAYEVRLAAMQQQLALAKDQYVKLEEENEEQNQMIREQADLLGAEEEKVKELTKSRDALKKEMKATHDMHKKQLEKLKKTYEDREKRRMNEDVERYHNEKEECERRIKSLQQQLTLATDRHHSEIRQKEADLEARYGEIKREIEKDVGQKLRDVEGELHSLRANHEAAQLEIRRLQKENEEMQLEHSLELDRKDALRDDDTGSLKGEIAKISRELSEKEFELKNATNKLKEMEAEMLKLISEHADAMKAKDQALNDQQQAAKNSDDTVRNELHSKENQINQLKSTIATMNATLDQLRATLAKTQDDALAAYQCAHQRESDLLSSLEKTKQELIDEQSRHEQLEVDLRYDVARLESKVKASEASLQEKRQQIDELHGKLEAATALEAKGISLQDEVTRLKSELRKCQDDLEMEQSTVKEKNAKLIELRSELAESLAKEECLQEQLNAATSLETRLEDLRQSSEMEKSELEAKLARLRTTVSKLEDEKVDLTVSTSRLDKEHQIALDDLEVLRLRLSDADCKVLELSQSRERETRRIEHLQAQIDSQITKNQDLEQRLSKTVESQADTRRLLEERQLQVEQLKSELADATNAKTSLVSRLSGATEMRVELEQAAAIAGVELESLRAKLDATMAEKDALAEELAQVGYEFDGIKSDYEDTKRMLADLEKKVSEGSNLANELEVAKEKVCLAEQYKATAAALQAKVVALQDKISDLEKQVRKEVTAKQAVEHKLGKLQEEHDDTKRRLRDLESASKIKANAADRKSKQVEELQKQISKLHDQLESENASESTILKSLHAMEEEYSAVFAKLEKAEDELQETRKQSNFLVELQQRYEEKEKAYKDLEQKLSDVENNLAKTRSSDLVDLQMQVDELEATKKSLSARLEKIEEDRDRKVDQLAKTSERYSATVEELQSKLEEQTKAKEAYRQRLIDLEADLAVKENQSNLLNDVHARLREQAKEKDALHSQLRSVEEELERRKKQFSTRGDQFFDLQRSYEEVKLEREGLEKKVEEIESELLRKERKITGIIERQAEDTSKLEAKLKEQTMAKATLQQEVDNLRSEMHVMTDVSSESTQLRSRISSLEASLHEAREAEQKAVARLKELEDQIHSQNDSQKELELLEQRYHKVNGEKEEVIAALEDVIHEVQSREEEIESLASILRKRDEELDHAKLIATKALASAQEMKSRYKEKGGRDSAQNSELKNKIENLNEQLQFLSKKNESLQRRTAKLEEELQERNKEREDLKEHVRTNGSSGHQQIRTASSTSSSLQGFHNGVSTDPNGFALMDEIEDTFPSFDSQSATSPNSQTRCKSHNNHLPFDEAMSTYTADIGETTKGWIHDFDTESTTSSQQSSFDEAKSEPGMAQSRRSLERDALRKYVRKRYMKHKASS